MQNDENEVEKLPEQEMAKEMPAYAARLLAPSEGVRYITRPRLLPLYMLVFMVAVVLALVAFSVLVKDQGGSCGC